MQICYFANKRAKQSEGDKTLAPLCRCVRGCDACDCVCVCVGRAALTAVNGRVTQASVSDYVRNWTERSIMNTFLCIKQTAATHSAPFHILQQNQTEANKNRTPCPALSTQLRDIGEKEKNKPEKKTKKWKNRFIVLVQLKPDFRIHANVLF